MDRETILSGLNAGQRAAAEMIDGPALVVAGAGSGKTTVLSRRVAALIASGIEPSSILLLTFTRMAARNMIDRAKKLHPMAIDVVGGTFHSIGHRLVVENHALFRLPEKPSILDPEDVKAAFRKIIAAKAGSDENLPKAGAIARAHSFAVNTKSTIEDVVYDRMSQFSHAAEFVAECTNEYRSYKRERGLLDYDDLLVAWSRMMDHPTVSGAIRDRFRYVLVDEHQDSNAIQCDIVFKLGDNVMAVGDPAQSIYAFRGAAPRTMFAFRERWPEARVINLEINYRSTEQILDVANFVDRSMSERFDRQLLPAPGTVGDIPSLVVVPTMDDEATLIAERILERKADGVDLSEQAILVRSMSAARHIEAELVRRRIPYTVSGGIKISDAAHVKDLLCLARTAVNVLDEPAWVRVLTMAKGVGDKKASDVYRRMTADAGMLPDPVAAMTAISSKHPDMSVIIDAYRAIAAGGPPVEVLERATSLLDDIFLRRYDDWRQRKQDVEAVIALAEGQEALGDFLASVTLDHSVDRKAQVIGADEEERPITLSTIHSAKGLEWDVVYIPQFVDGHLPSIYARDRDELEEEKRILYVAVTRPRRELVLVKPTIGRQGALSPESKFERLVSECLNVERVGQLRRPASLTLGLDADIDLW